MTDYLNVVSVHLKKKYSHLPHCVTIHHRTWHSIVPVSSLRWLRYQSFFAQLPSVSASPNLKTMNFWENFRTPKNRTNHFNSLTFYGLSVDWPRTATNRSIRCCTFCRSIRKSLPNFAATSKSMYHHVWNDFCQPGQVLRSNNIPIRRTTMTLNISVNRRPVQLNCRKFGFGLGSTIEWEQKKFSE